MGTMKQMVKKAPFSSFLFKVFYSVYKVVHNKYALYILKSKNSKDVFTEVYRDNVWEGEDSVSGPGSDYHQTKEIVQQLPLILNQNSIANILDIPCGDYHWMQRVSLNGIDYIGADIVDEIIQKNDVKYKKDGVTFVTINLLQDSLPKVDLIFCRDCLVHLSYSDVYLALENICKSGSKYLLTTTFIGERENVDIVTGQWRALNLQSSPFYLSKPQEIIDEQCTEDGGIYKDKALGLWKISDIKEILTSRYT